MSEGTYIVASLKHNKIKNFEEKKSYKELVDKKIKIIMKLLGVC